MKQNTLEKALELRQRGNIRRDQFGNFAVRSFNCDAIYIISVDALCSCPAMAPLCCHVVACFNASAVAQQFRWADDLETLDLVAEVHREAIAALPERVKAFCRDEYKTARQRLQGEYTSHEITRKGETVIVAQMQAPVSFHGAIQIT